MQNKINKRLEKAVRISEKRSMCNSKRRNEAKQK